MGKKTKTLGKERTKALTITDVVGQSEQYFCQDAQIGQKCNEQCVGCFNYQNKE
jgi:hypothetical protein